jgi:anthranilate phosphoribosyltransferase
LDHPAVLRQLLAGKHLTQEQSALTFGDIMDGTMSPIQAAGFLVALAAKGEHVDEVTGAARAMRERSLHVEHDLPVVCDIVGTGGDGANTINVSTMAALVVAAAGVPVAKHGNRAASSACGSADVLEDNGLALDVAPDLASRMLNDTGFTFMFAPRYHPAMKNVAPVRRELGVRTIFNVLGPLTNPARATHQVVGVARPELLELVGDVLHELGVRAAAVVHGPGGIDEIGGDGPTEVYAVDERGSRRWRLDPREFGIAATADAIGGGSLDVCSAAFRSILGGERSPRSDVIALNAALCLHLCKRAPTIGDALILAQETLASGAAQKVFERAKDVARG